jgi:hypothetical protein
MTLVKVGRHGNLDPCPGATTSFGSPRPRDESRARRVPLPSGGEGRVKGGSAPQAKWRDVVGALSVWEIGENSATPCENGKLALRSRFERRWKSRLDGFGLNRQRLRNWLQIAPYRRIYSGLLQMGLTKLHDRRKTLPRSDSWLSLEKISSTLATSSMNWENVTIQMVLRTKVSR